MSIAITHGCGKTLKVREEDAGKRARCPHCGGTIVIPAGSPAKPMPLSSRAGRTQPAGHPRKTIDEKTALLPKQQGRTPIPQRSLFLRCFGTFSVIVGVVYLLAQVADIVDIGDRLALWTFIATELPIHLAIEAACFILQPVLAVLLIFTGIRLRRSPFAARWMGVCYAGGTFLVRLAYPVYLRVFVAPLLFGSVETFGRRSASMGEGSTLIIPWEYLGVGFPISSFSLVLIAHAAVLLVVLLRPPAAPLPVSGK